MFSLTRLFKNYAETGSFSEKLNLHSFIDSEQFLTKTGDVGMILEVPGVDYECLDASAIDNLTKRLESAFRLFDENRSKFPQDDILAYRGKHVAWSPDGLKILASGDTHDDFVADDQRSARHRLTQFRITVLGGPEDLAGLRVEGVDLSV